MKKLMEIFSTFTLIHVLLEQLEYFPVILIDLN
jgi:hypothetical protein